MKLLKKSKFLIIGAGNMGISFIKALIQNRISSKNIFILEKKVSKELNKIKRNKKIIIKKSSSDLAKNFRPDIVLLAVKPDQLNAALDEVLVSIIHNSLIISIIAGKKTSELKKLTKNPMSTVRAMTNTPVSLGMGTSIIYFDNKISRINRKLSKEFLGLVGQVNEVKNESLIDTFTAIFGSGPAYIFLLMEVLTKIALKSGLKNAHRMVIQTFLGSLLLLLSDKISPEVLRQRVTSKGGTTEAALKILSNPNGLQKLFDKAIAKAQKRSKQLSKN